MSILYTSSLYRWLILAYMVRTTLRSFPILYSCNIGVQQSKIRAQKSGNAGISNFHVLYILNARTNTLLGNCREIIATPKKSLQISNYKLFLGGNFTG